MYQIRKMKVLVPSYKFMNNLNIYGCKNCHKINQSSTLECYIKKMIKINGPILIRNYIHECLHNHIYGYYANGAKIGFKNCDFITAPQKSSLFRLLFAHAIRFELQNIFDLKGCKVKIVELGPGKGNLIKGILDIVVGESNMIECVYLVECSSTHREEQFKLLGCTCMPLNLNNKEENKQIQPVLVGITSNNIKVYWFKSVYELDYYKTDKSSYIIYCNEYFDSIPIQQYIKTNENDNNSWKALHVGVDDDKDDLLLILRKDHILKKYESEILTKYYKYRKWAEFSMDMYAQWRHCLEIINRNGGSFFNIDYGYTEDQIPKSVTLRAFHQQKVVSILDNPGKCDITADIDFSTLQNISKLFQNVTSHRILTQEEFLLNMKIDHFKKKLIEWFPKNAQAINNDVKYLIDPLFMGFRYKVHIVSHKSQFLPLCF